MSTRDTIDKSEGGEISEEQNAKVLQCISFLEHHKALAAKDDGLKRKPFFCRIERCFQNSERKLVCSMHANQGDDSAQ